jgi:copper chaperone CopZ
MKTFRNAAVCMALVLFFLPIEAKQAESDSVSVWVDGLCGMCKTRIEEAALSVRGVQEASWDMDTKILDLTVDPEKFKSQKLHYKIASVGHDTEELLAPDPVYAALHECCKYRDFKFHDDALEAMNAGQQEVPEAGSFPNEVTGFVFESGENGEQIPLMGANVYWLDSGSGTITGEDGSFSIPLEKSEHFLVVSFVGFGADTLHIHEASSVEVAFDRSVRLEEVSVTHRVKPTTISFTSAYNIRTIHEKELTKAACCNLSESFETNPSVDASFTDAVTGTRKIEMLGLAGPYVQITRENMPDVRGLSALSGLTFIPGTWIEGMQLNTGSGSVVNGYESITGQINVELRKPETSDPFFLNLYGNADGAMEGNVMTAYSMGEKWNGSLLLHGNVRPFELDHNQDGFVDHPTGQTLVALKRFKFRNDEGFESQLGIRGVYSDRLGGQMDFQHERSPEDQAAWGSRMDIRRIEAWFKAGKVMPDRPFTSLGFQLSGLAHSQEAYFGRTDYDARQQSLYGNLIYQSILGNTNHQYRTGVSFQLDRFEEELSFGNFDRVEWVPGAFLEYTFNYLDRFTSVAGLRADYSNLYGAFLTPRLHLRYEPRDKTVLRASAGRGQKTPGIFAENIGLFASSRSFFVGDTGSDGAYGMDPEVAWSYGLNFAQGFRLGSREAVLNLDYYHTRFQNQIVVDLDRDPGEVHFYNLEGDSWSNSFQAQVDLEPIDRFDVRLAYRFNDVRTTYDGELLSRPLTSRNRGFINLAYETSGQWTFDVTWSWQDSKRIPSTESNPEQYRLPGRSPAFSLVNMQIGKTFFDRLEVYTGVENLFDYVQEDPILASDDPFGPYFDASLIWGPVFGRKIYAGLRFRIE